MKKCSKCYMLFEDDVNFCSQCGSVTFVFEKKKSYKKNIEVKKGNIQNIFKTIGIVLAISIAVGLWIYFINASFKKEIKNSIEVAWSEVDTDDAPAFLQKIALLSAYEIKSIEKGDTCTIHVVVRGVDLGNELKELSYEDFPQTKDEDVLNDYLLEIIEKCKYIETTTVIYAEPATDGYKIYFSDAFVDAMSGKVYSYYMDLIEGVLEE